MTEKAVDRLEISIENGNEKSAGMLLKGVGLLSGETPIIGSDDPAELEAEKERENFILPIDCRHNGLRQQILSG